MEEKLNHGLKDSGARETMSTGAQREPVGDRGRFDLIPAYPIRRLAQHYGRGALKYAERNWEKGLPLSRFIHSAESHLNAFKDSDVSEDHLAAILWNIAGYVWTEREILAGRLPRELWDVPWSSSINR